MIKLSNFFRSASGRAAIASGIMGLIAIAALVTGVNVRNAQGLDGAAFILFRLHDISGILQFLLLLPVAFSLCHISYHGTRKMGRTMLNSGITVLSVTVLLLLLNFPKIVGEPWYMFTQGVFGVWIILACYRLPGLIQPGLRWFGIVAGTGLALVGLFPLGFAIFVDKVILQIPAAPDEVIEKIPATAANIVLHYVLYTGTFMGVIPFPFWTILLGRKLLRKTIVYDLA